jgi:hypothetical protein
LPTCAYLLALSFATVAHGGEPIIDYERVTVWDATSALLPAEYDFVAVPLSHEGITVADRPASAVLGHRGTAPSKDGTRTIVIELKDKPASGAPEPARGPNNTGYPLVFPRPHSKKLLENDRVIVWDTVWPPGEVTPMHFHDKDAVAVFESNGVLQSTTPDGKKIALDVKFGDVKFSRRDRTHSEVLVSGQAHAIILV